MKGVKVTTDELGGQDKNCGYDLSLLLNVANNIS